jgi:hypothetical protein
VHGNHTNVESRLHVSTLTRLESMGTTLELVTGANARGHGSTATVPNNTLAVATGFSFSGRSADELTRAVAVT